MISYLEARMSYLHSRQSDMQPENQPLTSMRRNSSITEFNSDSGTFRYLSLSSSPMRSNTTAPFSSIQEPIRLNFAEPESMDLLPQSLSDFSKQWDQTILHQDFQFGYLPLGCSPSGYSDLELLALMQDVLASNTSISNLLLQHQQQSISEQQQYPNETCQEQEAYRYSSPEEGTQHQISEKNSLVKRNTQLAGDGSSKKMQCKAETLRSGNIQRKNVHWQPPYESILNDCQTSASYSTASAPMISNHGMPILPLDSPFSPSCMSTKLNRQEDIPSPDVFPPQLSAHNSEMMINSLPEKGKFLEAVLKAGPLLQTLLVAGPLPLWQHPPPALPESLEIPLVPISPNPPLTSPPEMTVSFPNSNAGFTLKPPSDPTIYDTNLSLISQASPYSPLTSTTPIASSVKKRLMSMDDSWHNASPMSPLKHTKLK